MTFHSGLVTIGLCCASSHHWTAQCHYDAVLESITVLAMEDGFCPKCGYPDTELERTGHLTQGLRVLVQPAPAKPSLRSRLHDFTGVDPVEFIIVLAIVAVALWCLVRFL